MKIFVPRQSISITWQEIFLSVLRLPFKSGCGKDVDRWEKEFADFIKIPHAISFISERAGTYFALKALREINSWEDPEIICPSYTFFTVPWAARLAGWQIRLADVLKEDLNLDPESLKKEINKKTKAVIVTHLNGKPARMAEIYSICKDNNLRLLEDCAHAVGIESEGRQLGAWDIGCFSFGDGKNLGTFTGGIITTSDSRLAGELKNIVSGFSDQSKVKIAEKIFSSSLLKFLTTGIFYPLLLYPLLRWFGYLSADNRKKDFLDFMRDTGIEKFKYKFSDLQALTGLSQLKRLSERNEARRNNSRAIRANLSPASLNKLLPWDGKSPHAMLHDAMLLNCGMVIVKNSLNRGIDVRLDYCSNCRDLPGMEGFPGEDAVGREIAEKVFFIPNHLNMNTAISAKMAKLLDNLISGLSAQDCVIRMAVKEDADPAAKILKNSFPAQDEQRILGDKLTPRLFKMLFKSKDNIFLIAENNGSVAGYIWVQLKPLFALKCLIDAPLETLGMIAGLIRESKLVRAYKYFRGKERQSVPYPKITSLAVEDGQRRKGLGKALVLEAQKRLAQRGRKEIFVLTSKDNQEAVNFYQNDGFMKLEENNSSIVLQKKLYNIGRTTGNI